MNADTITALAALVAAIGAVLATVISFLNRRASTEVRAHALAAVRAAEQSKVEIIATKNGVFEVGKAIDGRLTELLKLTSDSALAAGRLEGIATEKARVAEKAEQEPHIHHRNGDETTG